MSTITKRDGRECEFSKDKIRSAIEKAFEAVDRELTEDAAQIALRISNSIQSEISQNSQLRSVEQIQDLIERKLMSTSRKDVARAYITYRNERTKERERNSKFRDLLREKIYAKNVQNSNANMDEKSFGGRKGEAANALLKQYALDYCMSPKSKKHHLENRIYIHDLDSYAIGMHNCMTIPFDDLLEKGFTTRQTDVRPANSISTAFQLVAVIFQLQSLQQFG